MRSLHRTLTFLVLAVAIVGCTNPEPGPYNGGKMGPVPLPQLVYPVPGSSGLSTTGLTLVVAIQLVISASIIPGSGLAAAPLLVASNGATVQGTLTFTPPSPLPSPMAAYSSGDYTETVDEPTLSAHTTYTVRFDPTLDGVLCSTNCDVGTFTTK